MIRACAFLLAITIAGAALANDAGIAQRLAAADARDGHPLDGRVPAGHREFCASHRTLCTTATEGIEPATIDQVPLLQTVNAEINRAITYDYTPRGAWELAPAAGDCDDIAATKLAALMAAGMPREAMRFATVLTERGDPHLVLVAYLATGPLVLDNRRAALLPPSQTGYRFLAVEWLWGDGFHSWIAMGPGETP